MTQMQCNRELLTLIDQSPSSFHTIATIEAELQKFGFHELKENESWEIYEGGNYYVVRNQSSLIAFHIGETEQRPAFRIVAAHTDSPSFKLKANPELKGPGPYLRLNVEPYGGMLDVTWLDRPLSIAGRVLVREGNMIVSRLVSPDRDLLLIPNQAIHLNREMNKGMELNRQTDLCPLFSAGEMTEGAFLNLLAEELDVFPEDILSHELFLVNRQEGIVWGQEEEFISSPRLDDRLSLFTALKGFLSAKDDSQAINVLCCFDNEEVGSGTKQGARSDFLRETLGRINDGLDRSPETLSRTLANSFLVSADNAQAVHPNHPEKTDERNCCYLNKGIVIKENAAQKYTTDAFSRAIFMEVCRKAGQPCQTYANRSDIAGGSTLGNLSNTQVSLHAVDVGLAQLAMHSSFETAGAKDTLSAIRVFETFYGCQLKIDGANSFEIE